MPPLRIVQLNPAYAADLADPEALLARYTTLTGWAGALRAVGAEVAVVQRFRRDAQVVHDSVSYVFTADEGEPCPRPDWTSRTVVERVAALAPDLVHINGLMFHALTVTLRSALPPATALVAQDHSGYQPMRFPRLRFRATRQARQAFDTLDACSFTDSAQAEPWMRAGILGTTPVLAIVEGSTTLAPVPREAARRATGLHGSPAIVWVGRLDANKDPLTVLDALERVVDRLPDLRAWMIFHAAPLEREVRARIDGSERLAGRVTIVGEVPHADVASYLSAADMFISGSHNEGSGFALIEAMACGAVPVVTDIPSFRAITADTGERWRPGDASSCAAALLAAASRDLAAERVRVRARFESALSWAAIGARTHALYSELVARRRERV